MKWKSLILPAIALICIAGLVLYGYLNVSDMQVLHGHGPVALEERFVITITFLLSMIVVVPVFVLLFFFAYKYRATRENAHEKHAPNWDHDNWIAEAIWWFVPTVIIVFLSFVAWKSSHQLDPWKNLQADAPAMTVQVVALDWKWLFIYPELGIASVNEVVFPEKTPITFLITADAPMNAFWIPSLGGQIMAMQGMETRLNLMANSTGEYNGLSSNISGKGFAGMTFTAKSFSRDEYEAWVLSVKQTGTPLDSSVFKSLAKPSEYHPVTFYSSVEDGLYTDTIMKYMMGTHGATQESTGAMNHAHSMEGMTMPQ